MKSSGTNAGYLPIEVDLTKYRPMRQSSCAVVNFTMSFRGTCNGQRPTQDSSKRQTDGQSVRGVVHINLPGNGVATANAALVWLETPTLRICESLG